MMDKTGVAMFCLECKSRYNSSVDIVEKNSHMHLFPIYILYTLCNFARTSIHASNHILLTCLLVTNISYEIITLDLEFHRTMSVKPGDIPLFNKLLCIHYNSSHKNVGKHQQKLTSKAHNDLATISKRLTEEQVV